MPEVILLFIIVLIALIVMRVGAIALQKTGISADIAAFQAQSAFLGVGFTTSEAESVVTHPVRRTIIRILMLLGFGSITSALGAFVMTFARTHEGIPGWHKLAYFVLGLIVLLGAWQIPAVERIIDRVIRGMLRRATSLQIIDYEQVLRLDKGFQVANLHVDSESWLANESLHDLELSREGVLVLSITRESDVTLSTPSSDTKLHVGDRVLCYGLENVLSHLGARRVGDDGDHTHTLNTQLNRALIAEERVADELGDLDRK